MYKKIFFFAFSISILLLAGCSTHPSPIQYGQDECEHCRMLITDNRYGAEIVTDKGKVLKFDSIECLIKYALAKSIIADGKQKFFVTDFLKPETFTNPQSAFYIQNENFRSPMGLNVSAFGAKEEAQKFLQENGGTPMSWVDVIELVRQRSM
ncbi:MAG: nitrous oxide reductase accessory protein NosL [Bacteroidetes bacterium]|nr:nitrous oxide reductase accessory protein NosL [Bacteroidota bacterium]